MSVPLFAAIDIPMSRVPEDRLRQLFEDEEDRMLQLAEEQRCAWVSLIADTRARLAAVARGSLSRTSATQQPAVPETADPFPAIPEMAVRRMEWYDLQSAGHSLQNSTSPESGLSSLEMPNDLPTIRSANNVIQPSLDESPPASPTDKNLHSSKSDNALSTFLNDLPDSSRRLNWVERLKVYMDYMAGALVLMNSVAMLLEFELEGRQTGKFIGLLENVQAEAEWTATLKFFRALDAVFVFTFLAEWLVRVYLDRKKFLKDFANWFDTLCVFSGIADLILRVSVDSTASRSVVVLRLMRALKSLRAIRMVRSLRFFRGLRVLVQACQCFLPSLCWSMVLLGVFMTMGALMMGNLLQAFILDENLELADRQWLWSRYGTAYRATYTLFEITFAGNWPTSVRPVLDMASHAFVFFFAFYVTVVVFAVIRVISAVFLKDTFDAAQNDAEQQVIDKLRLKAQYVNKLEAIFQAIDETGRGMISQERLTNILANPKVAAYFETLGLDVHEGRALFHLLDNGDGEVTLDEFIDGIMRCKGNARAIDQVAMHADLKMLDRKISKLYRALKKADQGKNPAKSQASHLKVFRIDASTTLKAEDAF